MIRGQVSNPWPRKQWGGCSVVIKHNGRQRQWYPEEK